MGGMSVSSMDREHFTVQTSEASHTAAWHKHLVVTLKEILQCTTVPWQHVDTFLS